MSAWSRSLRRAPVSAGVASVTSILALAVAARAEGHGALQPLNATSHWRHGERAAAVTRADLAHTAVGGLTHVAAMLFWAVIYERCTDGHPPRGATLLGEALLLSAVAAATDYGATPRRFTPGWEFVLTPRAMAGVYAAMGAGLAIGTRMVRE